MNKNKSSFVRTIMVVVFVCLFINSAEVSAQEKTLYQRLGGYDALAAVVDKFIGKLAGDPHLAKFFAGHGDNSKMKIRQLVVDQLCAATGGPCVYIGRDMKTAHHGLGISESDWDLSVKYLVEALDSFKVPEKEKMEVLNSLSPLKNDIVQKM